MRLQQWYRRNASDPQSDIAPHFPAFFDAVLATDARTVVELGVRQGHSSSAWLMALLSHGGGELWSIDVEPFEVPHLSGVAMRSLTWHQLVADDVSDEALAWVPDKVDLVFIDTDHAFGHTLVELEQYAPRVKPGGRILLHDTTNEDPASHGENIGLQPPFPVAEAIDRWCEQNAREWVNDPQSWGLGTILL